MSDHESVHSTHSLGSMKTAQLHDHRRQADSLPIRRGSVFDSAGKLPPPALDERRKVRLEAEDEDAEAAVATLADKPSSDKKRSPIMRARAASVAEESPNKGILLNKPTAQASNANASRPNELDAELKNFSERRRRLSRSSANDSEATSRRSDSQETEEDVCFPMLPEHVRVNGIDFDEIGEFVQECHEEQEKFLKEHVVSSSGSSVAAQRYVPKMHRTLTKTTSRSTATGVQFGTNRVEDETGAPDRFSFFCSESDETVHAPDLESLLGPKETFQELFRNGKPTWWLDCVCPTDAEMKVLSKAFGIHPLTAEDIRMQETREKVELFKSYYFVCFHTFESDKESEDFLEPINVYMVVFRNGVLTFRFSPISHAANVRRRVRQLREYVDVSADWLCYALIDDITDSFAPVIHAIEYEADAIEDQVFLSRETDFSFMLQKIGESRRKVMTLMRLLSGKADVIKMFAKRCQDEVQGIPPPLTSSVNLANLSSHQSNQQAQPRADIALYLGDIQDHVVTMFQNLASYEKIFSRSHSNYLAQLQVQSFNSNNQVTEMLSKVTLIGTLLVPMNLITGLFGMNVTVPWEAQGNLHAFFGILGCLVFMVTIFCIAANWWFTRKARARADDRGVIGAAKSMLSFGQGQKARGVARDQARETKSILTFPGRFGRYD